MNINFKKGYTLLFAVLTAALVLGVAVFILSVSRKQFILATSARDSTYAYYAADSGIECLATQILSVSTSSNNTIYCNGRQIDFPGGELLGSTPDGFSGNVYRIPSPSPYPSYIPIPFSQGCANAVILMGKNAAGRDKTIIDSRGYNACTVDGDPAIGPRTVERGLRHILQ